VVHTCIWHHTDAVANASEQRFPTGLLWGFFVVHFGVNLSYFRLRRAMEIWPPPSA